jgi:hypothetical protein
MECIVSHITEKTAIFQSTDLLRNAEAQQGGKLGLGGGGMLA